MQQNPGRETLTFLVLIKETLDISSYELTFFCVREDSRAWGSFKSFIDMYLNYLGQYPAFLHPESPQGAQPEAAAVADNLMAATSFAYWYGRRHSSFTVPPLGHKLHHCWEEFHDQFCPMVLGRLILRSGKDSDGRPLNVLIFFFFCISPC